MGFSWRKLFSRITKPFGTKGSRYGFFSRNSVPITEDSAMKVAAFHRGLIYVSTQIAKLPWEIKDSDNNFVSGPISNLLSLAPNPEMNAFMFRCFAVQNAILHGNSYSEIERTNGGVPLALWPIPSQSVELLRTTTGNLVYKISQEKGEDVYLNPRDVFHVRNFHTKDGLVGLGLKDYAIETLGITLAADVMASGIFTNGGIPSGVLTHPGTLSDGAYARIKESWMAQEGGRKAGSTRLLEEGMTYTPIHTSPDTLQFLQSRQFGVLEVARFLGIPPTKLFDTTAATYNNVENSNLEVATDTLDAWAVNLELEADVKLLSNRYGGKYTELDLYSVFRGDMKTRADYFKALMSVAAITPNQIRQREGLAGYGPKGDKYYVATNNFTPVDRMDEVIDAQIASKQKPDTQPPSPKDDTTKALEDATIRFLSK